MKTAQEILNEYGCPDIPFDERVTMYYPAIINAMQEYAAQPHTADVTDSNLSKLIEYFEQQLRLQRSSEIKYTTEDALVDAIDVCKNIVKNLSRMPDDVPKNENEFLHYCLVNLLRLGEPAMRHIFESLAARLPDGGWVKVKSYNDVLLKLTAAVERMNRARGILNRQDGLSNWGMLDTTDLLPKSPTT